MKPHEYTTEEQRKLFLDHIRTMINYWANPNVDPGRNIKERLEGLAFSFLTMLDGCTVSMPAFVVVPSPHPEEREEAIEEGRDWWPDAPENIGDGIHDGQMLHELFYKKE